MDWTKPTTQMLGRFQPWHTGHTELFRRAIAKTGQVVILIRNTELDDKNPYTFGEREKQIVYALESNGYRHLEDFTILRVPNITHITYGRDVGYTIEQEHLDKEIENISATDIRKRLKDKESTENI